MSTSLSGGYSKFSASAQANYLRSVEETESSVSLNYYTHVTNKVSVQINGYGEDALTESGKSFYRGGKNPNFGITCGDYYIDSYKQGAFLTIGLQIKFNSAQSKNEFGADTGASFGDIFSASVKVSKTASQLGTSGSVTLTAYQIGGDPSELPKIFNKNSDGDYFALSCGLQTMQNCIKVANGMLDYAREEFTQQAKGDALTALGIGFASFTPVGRIGLTATSQVDDEILRSRKELSEKLNENEYYKRKLTPLINHEYPVPLNSAFVRKVNLLLDKVNHNIEVLMSPVGGAADCWNDPQSCKSVKTKLCEQLEDIKSKDLEFLEAIKYTLTCMDKTLINDGSPPGRSSTAAWKALPLGAFNNNKFIDRIAISDENYMYGLEDNESEPHKSYIFRGTSSDGENYDGTFTTVDFRGDKIHKKNRERTEKRNISPFYFDVYKSSRNN